MSHLIAPSILSSDFARLAEASEMINKSEADYFHIDVMDGRFVPNITFGMPVIKAIKKHAEKPFDVHLMIVEPEKYIADFKAAGADILTVHYEVSPHLHRTVQQIKNHEMQAGVALNPHTPVSVLKDIIQDLDLVLLMSVNPGFGGQSFIENTYYKIDELKELMQTKGSKAKIEVDGGVNKDNYEKLVHSGVDILVAGSYIFKSENPTATIREMKKVDFPGEAGETDI